MGPGAGVPDRRRATASPWLIQGVIFDITQRKLAEEEIAFLAYHDKLTGLPNRALFEEMLESALARARRFDLGVGVLFLDLDNFKLVNDSLGHHAGDQLLIQLARAAPGLHPRDRHGRAAERRRVPAAARRPRAGSGRASAGGPDAGLLIAESVAARVREALEQPFDLGGSEFFVSASIGISLYPQDASDAETLLRNADAAMYRSKEFERGGYVVYASSDDDPAHRLSFSTRLRQAVADRNWVLHYQPIIDLGDGTVRLGRSAGALAATERRTGGTGRVHPARRGDGADPGDRRLGPGGAGAPARRVARAGRAGRDRLQPVAATDVDRAPGREAAREARDVRRRAART